jgi:hypothetical protein
VRFVEKPSDKEQEQERGISVMFVDFLSKRQKLYSTHAHSTNTNPFIKHHQSSFSFLFFCFVLFFFFFLTRDKGSLGGWSHVHNASVISLLFFSSRSFFVFSSLLSFLFFS